MTQTEPGSDGVLVPVSVSSTIEETVRYSAAVASDNGGRLHLVYVLTIGLTDSKESEIPILERAAEWAEDEQPDLTITTSILGEDRYIAGPVEHVQLLLEYADSHGLEQVLLDPNYSVDATDSTLQPVEPLFDTAEIKHDVVSVSSSWWPPTKKETIRATVITGVSFVFYLALGGFSPFNVASGLIVGLLSGVLLRNVVFENTPSLGGSVGVIARSVVFLPKLFWEILKANVVITYIVLHPKLPIDPNLDRVEASVHTGFSVAVLANSITLTPGTLTVDAYGRSLLVHSLDENSRDGLKEGFQEHAVRYLFYGESSEDVTDPGSRGDVDPIPETAGEIAVIDRDDSVSRSPVVSGTPARGGGDD